MRYGGTWGKNEISWKCSIGQNFFICPEKVRTDKGKCTGNSALYCTSELSIRTHNVSPGNVHEDGIS